MGNKLIINLPDGREFSVKDISQESINSLMALESQNDNSDEDYISFPKDRFKSFNENEIKGILSKAKSQFKTMANALVAAKKSKATECVYSHEGKSITAGQKVFLILLVCLTSVTVLPWAIAWWLMASGNKNKLKKAEELIQIEIPSTIGNYNKTTDEDLKQHLLKLFKRQFKKANSILNKLADVTDLADSALYLKESKYYKEAVEFNIKLRTESEK